MARFNSMSVAAAFCFLAFVCVQVAAQPMYAPEIAPEGAPMMPPTGAPILEPVPPPYAPELSPGTYNFSTIPRKRDHRVQLRVLLQFLLHWILLNTEHIRKGGIVLRRL